MPTSPRTMAGVLAAARIGFGVGFLVAPRPLAAAWLGRDGARPAAGVLAAAVGGRDLVIGVGTAWAVGQGVGASPWLSAGALADACDCLAMLRARRSLPPLSGAGGIAVAAAGAVTGAWLARALD
jgi:hypothetical protein